MEQSADPAIQHNAINKQDCADSRMDGSRRDGVPSVEPLSEARTPHGKVRPWEKRLSWQAQSGRME